MVDYQRPFMYGVMEPDGRAYMDEFCVDLDSEALEEMVQDSGMTGHAVVPLYLHDPELMERLIGRIEELQAALQPFSDEASRYDEWWPNVTRRTPEKFNLGALREADRLVKQIESFSDWLSAARRYVSSAPPVTSMAGAL